MEIDADDIGRVCAEVHRFSRKADLRWKGLPVIAWEFADIGDFMRTRAMILQALSPQMIATGGHGRKVGHDTEEIDCNGVTFRLICKQKMMTRGGPYGAAELKLRRVSQQEPRKGPSKMRVVTQEMLDAQTERLRKSLDDLGDMIAALPPTMTDERKQQIRSAMEGALSVLDDLHDAALDELREGSREGTYRGDPYDAPDDCESIIAVKHGDLRKARKALREALSGAVNAN